MDMKDTLLAVSGLLGGSGGGGGSSGPLITQQPSDASGEIGVTVRFSVTASGTGLTYMWQSNMYEEWRDTSFSTSTTATLALKVTQERDGVQYRCRITDGEGHVVYSNPATLRVTVPEPVIITKTITANGTYAASSDNADGYSEVTVNVSGGGGGGISGVSVGQDITLTEPVRAMRLDVPSGWDWCCALINGSFTSATWLYWTRNELTTNHYEPKTTSISRMFPMFYNQYQSNFDMIGMAATGIVQYYTSATADYLYFYGYDKDFSTGTRFLLIGGSYADL